MRRLWVGSLLALLLVPLLLAPPAQARDTEERPERVTTVVWLKWSNENLGVSNFSRGGRLPADVWADLPGDVRATISAWWRDPHARVDAVAAQRAQDVIVGYCMQWNTDVFARRAAELARDLDEIAPSARLRSPPDGLGALLLSGVPEDRLGELVALPYVRNIGRFDAAFETPAPKDKSGE